MNSYVHFEQRQFGYSDRITYMVQRLILLNVIVFAVQLLLDIPFGRLASALNGADPPGGVVISWFGFQPSAFLNGALWKPLTYMFIHGGLMHLFMNMLWLFFFGPEVERTLGSRQFTRFYLICGTLGVLLTIFPLIFQDAHVSVFGASGAIMGIMVAYAMLNPEREFFLFPLPIPVNARALVFIIIAINIISALQDGSTSVATHFGGMLTGYGYMKLVPKFRKWKWAQMKSSKGANAPKTTEDAIKEAVDNIFKFEPRGRGHWDR